MARHVCKRRAYTIGLVSTAVVVVLALGLGGHQSFGVSNNALSLVDADMMNKTWTLPSEGDGVDKMVTHRPTAVNGSINELKPAACGVEQRAVEVRRMCGKSQAKTAAESLSKGSILGNLLVDDVHQIIYCYIPKVACSTFKALLANRANNMTSKKLENTKSKLPFVHHQKFLSQHGIRMLRGYSKKDREMRLRNYFKFIVVRHPFDRLLSAWRDKIEYSRFHAKVSKVPSPASKARLRAFLQRVAGGDKNRHWGDYNRWCRPCDVLYDGVLRLETIDQDMDFILDRLPKGRPGISSSPSGRHLAAANTMSVMAPSEKLDSLNDFYKNIDVTTKRKLLQRYQRDFAVFGYQWNITSDRGSCRFPSKTSTQGCC